MNSPNYGKTRTAEQKERLKEGLQQAWDSKPERKQRLSISMAGSSNPQYGKKPKNAQPILLHGIEYRSIADAAKATGLTPHKIKKIGTKI